MSDTPRREQAAVSDGPSSNRYRGGQIRRWPLVAFVLLAALGGAALFFTQHLKVSTPFLNGDPRADPPTFNPISGGVCRDLAGKAVSYRSTRVGFYLQHSSGRVSVYALDQSGRRIATLAGSGRFMRARGPYSFFSWNGRRDDGRIAADGAYRLQVVISTDPHAIVLDQSIRVLSDAPKPKVTSVKLLAARGRDGPHSRRSVEIAWQPANDRGAEVLVWRAPSGGRPRLVKRFGTDGRRGVAVWDGTIDGRPAPRGRYLVSMRVLDTACTGAASSHDPAAAGAPIVNVQ
jgi:hypothetical protein